MSPLTNVPWTNVSLDTCLLGHMDLGLMYQHRILALFHSVSGLKCNLDKTFVVPVGNFRKDNLCSDLKDLKWVDEFKVLGIVIDNKLKKLKANFDKIFDKVEKKAGLWTTYGLTFNSLVPKRLNSTAVPPGTRGL